MNMYGAPGVSVPKCFFRFRSPFQLDWAEADYFQFGSAVAAFQQLAFDQIARQRQPHAACRAVPEGRGLIHRASRGVVHDATR